MTVGVMEPSLTPQQLTEIQARADAATNGPWRVGTPNFSCQEPHGYPHPGPPECKYAMIGWHDTCDIFQDRDDYASGDTDAGLIAGMWDYEEGGIRKQPDADFIAHARHDIPALLAEVRRLTEALTLIDRMLTTVAGDNVPDGDVPKMHVRNIARDALAVPVPGKATRT